LFYPENFVFNRHVFLGTPPVLLVETGDFLTLVVGLVIVIVIAFIANPHYLSELNHPSPIPTPIPTSVPLVTDTPVPVTILPVVIVTPTPNVTPTPQPTFVPLVTDAPVPVTTLPVVTATATPNVTPTPQPTFAPPYRIVYASNPFLYPKFKLPANMDVFGAGDVPLRGREMVPFAYVSDSRGGLTHTFLVPYPVWAINTMVIANLTPQYGDFKMVLCYASNGTVINGEEILNRGSMYRVIETSNTEMYMIITTAYIDKYIITFETPRNYYDQYNKPPA
jgi:hypothetical protein